MPLICALLSAAPSILFRLKEKAFYLRHGESGCRTRRRHACTTHVLTYMSIRDSISDRIAAGDLFPVEPAMPDDPVRRSMVVSLEIRQLLNGPWWSRGMARRCNELRADLEAFVKGDVIAVCLVPRRARAAYMARLDRPVDEVWDIRSRDPRPALRVLGRFADRDLFVALTCASRSKDVAWLPRAPLGNGYSREWRDAIVECKAVWRQLLHPYEPIHGDYVHDYLSNAFPV